MANQYRRDKRTRASHGCNAQPSSLRNPQEWSTEALGRKRARIGKTRLAAHDFRQQAPGGRAEREPMVPVARFVAYPGTSRRNTLGNTDAHSMIPVWPKLVS